MWEKIAFLARTARCFALATLAVDYSPRGAESRSAGQCEDSLASQSACLARVLASTCVMKAWRLVRRRQKEFCARRDVRKNSDRFVAGTGLVAGYRADESCKSLRATLVTAARSAAGFAISNDTDSRESSRANQSKSSACA